MEDAIFGGGDRLLVPQDVSSSASPAEIFGHLRVSSKRQREADEVDSPSLSSSSPPSPPSSQVKRARTLATPIVEEPAGSDSDDDDDNEEVRVLVFRGGKESGIKDKTLVARLKSAFQRGGLRAIPTPNNVPDWIETVFCVYNDAAVDAEVVEAELINNAQLMRLCMDGRLRMTPLSAIASLLPASVDGTLTLDVLCECSFERRAELVKFKSSVEVIQYVPPQWRIPSGSILFPPGTPVVRSHDELYAYLKEQMFRANISERL